jgi:hypothetical protein
MKKEDIADKVRFYLHDENKVLWSDEELYFLIDEAALQYSKDTEIFCGVFNIHPDINGDLNYPDDYIHFLCGWNVNGQAIEAISVNDIWDFDRQGEIECIYDDVSSAGTFEVYPEKDIKVSYNVATDDYGVLCHDYGLLEYPLEYGIVYSVAGFEFAGDIIYCRRADVQEIADYTALIYKTLELAHSTESEFADINMARLFRDSYTNRIARFKHNIKDISGYSATGIFY